MKITFRFNKPEVGWCSTEVEVTQFGLMDRIEYSTGFQLSIYDITIITTETIEEVIKIYNMFLGSIPFLYKPHSNKSLMPKQIWVGEMAQHIVRSIILMNDPKNDNYTQKTNGGIQNL